MTCKLSPKLAKYLDSLVFTILTAICPLISDIAKSLRVHEISDQNIAEILRKIDFHEGQMIDYPDIVEQLCFS